MEKKIRPYSKQIMHKSANTSHNVKANVSLKGKPSDQKYSPTEKELYFIVATTTQTDTQPTLSGEMYNEAEWMDTFNQTVHYGDKGILSDEFLSGREEEKS